MKVSTVAQMRNLDRSATEEFGISEDLLMENAGEAVHFVMFREFGIKNKKFVVFCGTGNNGGDGFVVARKIHSNGGEATIFLLDDETKYKGVAKRNFEIVSKLPIEISRVTSVESMKSAVVHSDAIVDAIFGTGLVREVGGVYKKIIQVINESQKTVFSVDIPSGINGDTGEVMGGSYTSSRNMASKDKQAETTVGFLLSAHGI